MRIGIDARMYSTRFTGIGRYVKELIDNISVLDTDNEYIIFFNDEEYINYMPPNPRISKRRVTAGYYTLKEQTSFVTDLNRENLDIMHFTHFNAPVLYNRPSVVTIHDLTLSKFPGQNKTSIIHKLGYQVTIKNIVSKAWRIICVSEHTKEDAIKMLGAWVSKIRVVYEGISKEISPVTDKGRLDAIKQKFGITNPFFLYTGAWRKHKNLVNLIKAFNLYRNMYDTNVSLVLAGKVDPNYKEVTDSIRDFGLGSHVIMPGFIADEDLPGLYSAAQAFIFPSLYEGFGLPPLEAMACGCPVAVSNVSSLPEICGDAALYFDPNSPDKICESMHQIVVPETRDRLIAAGLEHVKTFSWDDMTKKTLEIYKEVYEQIQKQKQQQSQQTTEGKAQPQQPNTTPPAMAPAPTPAPVPEVATTPPAPEPAVTKPAETSKAQKPASK
jgi:glycosyltransferase involved in cell wall biosynthesis